MLTVSARDEDLFASVRAGARGYLLKNALLDELVDALRRFMLPELVSMHSARTDFGVLIGVTCGLLVIAIRLYPTLVE